MTDMAAAATRDQKSDPPQRVQFEWAQPLIRKSRGWRGAWLVMGVLALLLGAAFVLACWFLAIPEMVQWGFKPLSMRAVPAALAIFFLALLPGWAVVPGFTMIGQAARAHMDTFELEINQKLDDIRNEQKTVEEQLGELEEDDATGLMGLIKYSRLQLEAYYTIGLRQTQQSFRNSVIAMWLGFLIILVGVARYFVPPHLFPATAAPENELRTLTLAAGGIVEVISALFLWVYKSSIEQLTYFYDRQMHLHGILLSNKIASSMQNADDTKRLIVSDILAKAWRPERGSLPTADRLKELLKAKPTA